MIESVSPEDALLSPLNSTTPYIFIYMLATYGKELNNKANMKNLQSMPFKLERIVNYGLTMINPNHPDYNNITRGGKSSADKQLRFAASTCAFVDVPVFNGFRPDDCWSISYDGFHHLTEYGRESLAYLCQYYAEQDFNNALFNPAAFDFPDGFALKLVKDILAKYPHCSIRLLQSNYVAYLVEKSTIRKV